MRILLLSGANSPHTLNWANSLAQAGNEIYVVSQHLATADYNENVNIIKLPGNGIFGFVKSIFKLKKLLKIINPDIVNAHRAARNSLLAWLSGFRPYVLSVWGSDVYDFPYKSRFHYWFVKSQLVLADAVASTSMCMAKQTLSLAPGLKEIVVTPFGVDSAAYTHLQPVSAQNSEQIVVGTVKTMASKYGIDTLIDAFFLVLNKQTIKEQGLADRLVLRLVGGGPQAEEYKQHAQKLGINKKVDFVGRVLHTQVPNELAKLDIYVALSRLESESFGVAVIEAGAAGRPVVVSDAGGLPEVTLQNKTGLIVPRENPRAAADAIEKLILNPRMRYDFGVAAQKHVAEKYSRKVCVETMMQLYKKVAKFNEPRN